MNEFEFSSKLYMPPKPNWKLSLDDETNFYFQFYSKKGPNRFQRWVIYKMLGIKLRPVDP